MGDGAFGTRLVAACGALGPLCVGIDPSAELLAAWGLPDDASGLAVFGGRCAEALGGVVAVVKPQVAFFERHGSPGMAALEATIAACRAAGLLVVADAKRGDVGTTSDAYAEAWLGPRSPLAADAVTAHAYLGLGALAPLVAAARDHGRAVLVVARSSNPEGLALQTARQEGGATVAYALLADIAALNDEELAAPGAPAVGSVGVVVGATLGPSDFDMARLRGPVLAPGLGAQGAGPADVAWLLAACPPGSVFASASRSVLAAGPDAAALAGAARALQAELVAAAPPVQGERVVAPG